MNDYIALIVGIGCAGLGGELFVRGSVGLAQWARISPGIIGATVAAFAASSPELSVAINSAMAGKPQISLGDALGSNVVNVALILGLALVISGVQSPRDSVMRDFPIALLIPVITVFCFSMARCPGSMVVAIGASMPELATTIVAKLRGHNEVL